MGTNEDGVPVANILGRDITEIHEQQEAKERELKASAAKDQILSDITKTLYSYNATVNLNTGKYSLIIGTGMEEIIQHFSRTDDYETACGYLLEKALPEYPEEMNRCFSLQALRQQQNLSGHIGQIEYLNGRIRRIQIAVCGHRVAQKVIADGYPGPDSLSVHWMA